MNQNETYDVIVNDTEIRGAGTAKEFKDKMHNRTQEIPKENINNEVLLATASSGNRTLTYMIIPRIAAHLVAENFNAGKFS